ncbi:hypothetical protein Lal_00012523, partial [Lupinus albus]
YHELGQHAFGEKLGLWIVVPQQLVCEVGVDIVYMVTARISRSSEASRTDTIFLKIKIWGVTVTGGKSLQKVHNLLCNNCKPLKTSYFIMIFASVHFVLAHLPNFNAISGISLAATVMSLRLE